MSDTVVLIDGEYVRHIFKKRGFRVNIPDLVGKTLDQLGIQDSSLLRVYFYTSPPYQPEHPNEEEKQRYKGFQKFINFLEMQDSFQIRLGKTEKRKEGFSQKMVDVLLSIDLVELSAKAKIRTAILMAGDSDFVPAVKKAKDNGVKVILCCSSAKEEYHINLWKEADKRVFIDDTLMQQCSN
jgi:uncharacterized LabA/DUF88 family protein